MGFCALFQAMIKAQNEMNGTVALNSPKPDQTEEEGSDKFNKTEPMLDFVKSKKQLLFSWIKKSHFFGS